MSMNNKVGMGQEISDHDQCSFKIMAKNLPFVVKDYGDCPDKIIKNKKFREPQKKY